ncbi:hypothetical protein ACGFZP_23250 [Kitasatospora sp. NPDC048239]|uniref:hypothetical protein n=1 Tax=Kitasatospora sp. NPDC048239 TaxID=3364046 RepID=UPI00371D25DE
MARRNPEREYREVVTGPAKHELNQPKADWNPLDDYLAANASRSAPSGGSLIQRDAVRSTCPCSDCAAYRTAG